MNRATQQKPTQRLAMIPLLLAALLATVLSGCGNSADAIVQAIQDRLASASPAASASAAPSIAASIAPEAPAEPPASDEAEAARFAAAVETYQGYLVAVTLLDFSDPTTFDASLAYLDDDSARKDRALYEQYHLRGFNSTGTLSLLWADGPAEPADPEVTLQLTTCISVTERTATVDGVTTSTPDANYLYLIELIPDARGEFGYLIAEQHALEQTGLC